MVPVRKTRLGDELGLWIASFKADSADSPVIYKSTTVWDGVNVQNLANSAQEALRIVDIVGKSDNGRLVGVYRLPPSGIDVPGVRNATKNEGCLLLSAVDECE